MFKFVVGIECSKKVFDAILTNSERKERKQLECELQETKLYTLVKIMPMDEEDKEYIGSKFPSGVLKSESINKLTVVVKISDEPRSFDTGSFDVDLDKCYAKEFAATIMPVIAKLFGVPENYKLFYREIKYSLVEFDCSELPSYYSNIALNENIVNSVLAKDLATAAGSYKYREFVAMEECQLLDLLEWNRQFVELENTDKGSQIVNSATGKSNSTMEKGCESKEEKGDLIGNTDKGEENKESEKSVMNENTDKGSECKEEKSDENKEEKKGEFTKDSSTGGGNENTEVVDDDNVINKANDHTELLLTFVYNYDEKVDDGMELQYFHKDACELAANLYNNSYFLSKKKVLKSLDIAEYLSKEIGELMNCELVNFGDYYNHDSYMSSENVSCKKIAKGKKYINAATVEGIAKKGGSSSATEEVAAEENTDKGSQIVNSATSGNNFGSTNSYREDVANNEGKEEEKGCKVNEKGGNDDFDNEGDVDLNDAICLRCVFSNKSIDNIITEVVDDDDVIRKIVELLTSKLLTKYDESSDSSIDITNSEKLLDISNSFKMFHYTIYSLDDATSDDDITDHVEESVVFFGVWLDYKELRCNQLLDEIVRLKLFNTIDYVSFVDKKLLISSNINYMNQLKNYLI